MASASAFQAEYAGSIPVSRSNNPRKRIFYLGAGIEKVPKNHLLRVVF